MLINLTVLNFLLFLLAFVVSSASFANSEFNPSAFFTAGVDYTYKAGTRGFGGGIVHLQQKDNVIHLYVKIQFLAAGTFSRTNLNEVLTLPILPFLQPNSFLHQTSTPSLTMQFLPLRLPT